MNQNDVDDVSLLTDRECARQVGRRFCQARQSLGLTTKVMAELLGASRTKIIQVEKGELFLPTSWGDKMDRFLGINKNWLLTGDKRITKAKTQAYETLFELMRVPIIEENIFNELKKLKTIFKDRIREYERVHEVSLNGGLQ
ncbi:MAG: helix-turn-helix transcriptional regulator [Candidatus Aminicenantes bacterium]|nr:helix-turn-helix transcriptional regulator [Candidatus Aminicenantes bacterium]